MATITSNQVMLLRNQTGAGIMDCKNALKEADGDIAKAIEILRKKGVASLAKRAGREMKEGIISIKMSENHEAVSMVEINCETDFVAKNPEVKNFADEIAQDMLAGKITGNPAEDKTATEKLQAIAVKTGENMQIRRGVTYKADSLNSVIHHYLHSDNKKGAIIELIFEGSIMENRQDLLNLAKELAMQSVAMHPKWVSQEDVPKEVIEKEKEIYKSTPQAQGKDGIALEKMLEGKIKKFYQENCLMEQASIREPKTTISKIINELSTKLNGKITVKRFDCYYVGVE